MEWVETGPGGLPIEHTCGKLDIVVDGVLLGERARHRGGEDEKL